MFVDHYVVLFTSNFKKEFVKSNLVKSNLLSSKIGPVERTW